MGLVRAAFPYREPLPALLYAFKYNGSLRTGLALGDWMAGVLGRTPELRNPHALVPVPLHPARRRARGFNQALILAQRLTYVAKAPLLEALVRSRDTAAQWKFPRLERARRLSGSFSPAPGVDVRGKDLLLIDDVCTSGGTLEGCARALRGAGASSVRAFVLARG